MRLDHLSYACSRRELSDVVQRLGADLGASFRDGGRHPQFGTANFILPLQNGSYLEVVAALDHPAADKAPFGQAVNAAVDDGRSWFAWVIAVDDISPFEVRLGRTARDGHRIRPDGFDLRWKQIGVLDTMNDPQLPFIVEWLSEAGEHPSSGPASVAIERIEMSGDPARIAEWLDGAGEQFLDGINVEWVDGEDTGIQAVWFETPHGSVRID